MSRSLRVKRVGLVALTAALSLNAWTGSPLLALWVGSRVQGSGPPTMAAIGVVSGTLFVISVLLVKALRFLGDAYDKLMGIQGRERQSPWLRSLRGEREDLHDPERDRMSPIELVMVASVLIAFIAFEVWFFFFSSSPIDQRSGRG
jgi:hypothetical protein